MCWKCRKGLRCTQQLQSYNVWTPKASSARMHLRSWGTPAQKNVCASHMDVFLCLCVQVGLQSQYSQGTGQLVLYLGNKHAEAQIQALSIRATPPAGLQVWMCVCVCICMCECVLANITHANVAEVGQVVVKPIKLDFPNNLLGWCVKRGEYLGM